MTHICGLYQHCRVRIIQIHREGTVVKDEVLTTVVRLLGHAAHAAYSLALSTPVGSKNFNTPKVGDVVMEITTYYWLFDNPPRARHANGTPLDAIGVLEEDVREPIKGEWDEEDDGPRPTERIFYIRTFDGRRFRWENADVIRVPSELKMRFAPFESGPLKAIG